MFSFGLGGSGCAKVSCIPAGKVAVAEIWQSDASRILRRAVVFSICLLMAANSILTAWPAAAPPPPPDIYRRIYTAEGNFFEPTIGPSSPQGLFRADGRLWIIIAHDTGLIEMDNVTAANSSFDDPAPALSLRIQDYGLHTPISNIVYVVPGKSTTGQYESNDDLSRNGLLGFVAGGHLVLLDPFTEGILLNQDLGFQPRWFTQDVVSAGETYDFPMRICNGPLNCKCNRFFVAANDTHVSVIRVNYRSSQDSPQIPSGGVEEIISLNMSVVAPPLAYHLPLWTNRSGIFVPTTSNVLAAFSIDGQHRTNIPLNLSGEPANVSAPIGFSRSTDTQMLYVPLKSATKAGILSLRPVDLAVGNVWTSSTVVIDDPAWKVTAQPDPANTDAPFFTVTRYSGGVAVNSEIDRATESPMWTQPVLTQLSSPVTDFFYSPTTSQVMALDKNGTIWEALLTDEWRAYEFPLGTATNGARLLYAGSRSGSKYSMIAATSEMIGLIFEPQTGEATVFWLVPPWSPPPSLPPAEGASSILVAVVLIVASVIIATVFVLVALAKSAARPPRQPPPYQRS